MEKHFSVLTTLFHIFNIENYVSVFKGHYDECKTNSSIKNLCYEFNVGHMSNNNAIFQLERFDIW